MVLFNDDVIAGLLENDLETANIDFSTGIWSPSRPFFLGSSAGRFIKWHTFKDLEQSVIDDVKHIRGHPLINPRLPIYGFYYDVSTGKLVPVPAATEAGKPR